MDINNIPNCLKRYRKRRRLKQMDVAQILGVKNASMISRWEKGLAIPKTETLLKLALIYRISSDALYSDFRLTLGEEIRKKEAALKLTD